MHRHSPQLSSDAARLGVAVLVATLCLALAGLVGRTWSADAVQVDIPAATEVVVLGSSIAMASLPAEALAEGLSIPGASVLHLGERASQPAHWLALLRHHVRSAGVRPAAVVVVTPLEVLPRERLRSDADAARLLALLRRPDSELWSLAVGEDGDLRFWARQQASARRTLRVFLGDWLPRLVGWTGELEAARAAASAVPRLADTRPVWLVDPAAPRPGRANDDPTRREPEAVPLSGWQLAPALVEEAHLLGAQLWWVAPPVRPADRGPVCARSRDFLAVQRAAEQLGARVLDASDAPIDERWFRSRYHLEGAGAERFATRVGAVIAGEPPPWPTCGTTPARDAG